MQFRNKLSIYFCLLTILVCGQEEIYFNNRLDYFETYDESKCIVNDNNGYIVFGITTDSVYDYFAYYSFIKIDSTGETIWIKTYGDSYNEYFQGNPGSLIKADSTHWYACGYERVRDEEDITHCGYLIYLTANFDTIWTKSYCESIQPFDTTYVFRQMKLCSDGNLIFAGERYIPGVGSDIWLLKTDTVGNKLWEKFFNEGLKINQGHSVIQTTDGGFALGCYFYELGNNDTGDPIIIKTDSLGITEWTYNPGSNIKDHKAMLAISIEGYIIAATNYGVKQYGDNREAKIQIIKIRNDGTVIIDKKYGEPLYDNYLNQVRILNNGDIVTTGIYGNYEPGMPSFLGWILCTDQFGNKKWYREYMNLTGDNSHNYLRDIVQTDDNGLIACGQVLPAAPDTGNPDIWVLKLDSLGYDTSTVGILERELDKYPGLVVYPSPASREFTISLGIPAKRTLLLEFYNQYGLKTEELEIPKGQREIAVNASKWPGGMYVAVVKEKGLAVGKKKFVVR